jgi:TorA maturation chaperone TorD
MSDFRSNKDEWKVILLAETLLLGVLGKAIQSKPDKEWLQSLIDEDIFSEFPLESKDKDIEAGLFQLQSWCQENQGGISHESFSKVEMDYSRLFVGLGKTIAPPWESVYFNEARMIFQEQTLQVRQWYRRFGLEPENLHKEPDDHIGLELSFLAYLAGLSLQALEAHDEDTFEQIMQAQRQFISEHLLQWAPDWCKLVEENATTYFYCGLAKLIRGTLYWFAESLGVQAAEGRKL